MSARYEEQQLQTLERVKAPKSYCCVIHNDNITTMDFVVMAICEVFDKSSLEATKIMMYIHNHGKAKIGSYCYDIAATKKNSMDTLAHEHGFPLKTTVEKTDL